MVSCLDKCKKEIKRWKQLKWSWLGSTLNPYYEGNATSTMINDDRFISHTIKTAYNKSGWIFGPDTTGDMLNRSNIEGLIGNAENLNVPLSNEYIFICAPPIEKPART